MSTYISGTEWKKALTSILEELDDSEYKKMLWCLDQIPKGVKTSTSREEMPQLIIQHFGVDESISVINKAMDWIPRKDPKVQELLRPFVDKLRKKHEEENRVLIDSMKENREIAPENQSMTMTTLPEAKGKKRKHENDTKSVDEEPEPKTRFQRNDIVNASDSSDKEQKVAADQPQSSQPDTERKISTWRKTIKDILTSSDLGNKAITGKVVQKSALCPYKTKQGKEGFFFCLGVSDETSCIKVIVYEVDLYQYIQKGSCYSFRDGNIEENFMKITKRNSVARTAHIDVPEKLEMEALKLINPLKPVCSIAEARQYADKTAVSVEGTVTEIGPIESIKVKNQQKEKQDFHLKDDNDSISITLWGKDTKQLGGISDGDFVRVTNVKTNHYKKIVSLNSTDTTRIYKIQSAAIQNVTIEIISIQTADKRQTHLDAGFNNQIKTCVVSSKLLAKAFGVRLDNDFADRLLEKLPLSANVKIQGSKIKTITAAK